MSIFQPSQPPRLASLILLLFPAHRPFEGREDLAAASKDGSLAQDRRDLGQAQRIDPNPIGLDLSVTEKPNDQFDLPVFERDASGLEQGRNRGLDVEGADWRHGSGAAFRTTSQTISA